MLHPGVPNPKEAEYRPSSPFDHEPTGIGRFSSAVLFLGIWAGCATVSFWHTTPPEFAASMLWIGSVIAAVAGYMVAGIRRLRPRRRACLGLGLACALLPFLLGAVLR